MIFVEVVVASFEHTILLPVVVRVEIFHIYCGEVTKKHLVNFAVNNKKNLQKVVKVLDRSKIKRDYNANSIDFGDY